MARLTYLSCSVSEAAAN